MQPFSITETYELLKVVEKIELPTTFLSNIFFADAEETLQDVFPVEIVKKNRRLAPFIVKGSRGFNISREQTQVKMYKPPLIGARRTIGLEDISRRIAGEMPVISTLTPADRALKMQGEDLRDLMNMLTNRREAMAASLLTTGSIPIKGFGEDGQVIAEETITFDADWLVSVETNWSNPAALIYDDLKATVEYIVETTGTLPDVAICGKNIESYLLRNEQFQEMAQSFRENLAIMSIEPRFESPHARRIGMINALGLEVYSYLGTYYDGITGTVKRYIPDDCIIIGTSKSGKMLYGRVDLMKNGQFQSYAASNVPLYTYSDDAQTSSLTVYSRSLPLLPVLESVRCLEVVSS